VGSTRLTGFARPDLEDEVFGRIASHLRESSHEWDLLDLQYMDPAQPFFDLMSGERGSSVHDDCGICPRIKLPSEWQVYLSGLQPKRRSELKRLMRRAEEQDAEIEHVGDPEQLSDALDDLVRLNQTRLRAKLGQNWSWSEPYRSFTRETLERFIAEGRLRLLFMKVGKSRKAANYMFRYKDTMYGELNGFDDDGASANLLRPLMGAGIRAAIEEGCTTFDLQLGDQPSKFEWGVADLLSLSRIAVYGSSLAGRLRETRDGVVERTFAHRG
jgi:CelD/BcsL family acetyltransferase involved in cellulose biosynthesis